ncbi:Histidine kinase 3 [Camellia lanceoleosa]|uniref:Histidine kinase 3 n=1 Tax=Camellia lanceoleosa TaxID=1840588 RepID=A0ACC0ITP1_9ERIC|nr:Histidine kinase 3 [Camellia lanceoleosa]
MNWFINGGIMETKTGFLGDDTKIWVKFWEMISEITSKIYHRYYQYIGSKRVRKTWWKDLLVTWIVFWTLASLFVLWYMSSQVVEKRKETLASMCDERARMLQDQFNVSMNHVQAMSIVISTFHHGKRPSTIDQDHDSNAHMAYWLSNTSVLLFLLQRTLKAIGGKPPTPTSFFGRMTQGFRSSLSSANLSFCGLEVYQAEAKYPALHFKQ